MANVLTTKIQLLIMLFFLVSSCAGYRFRKVENPFAAYDIHSIAVPMFVNRSIFHNVNIPLAREIKLALSEYPGLYIYSGDEKRADAMLIGIVESVGQTKEAVVTESRKFTDGELEKSIGDRAPFYVPNRTYYQMNLRLVLIKRPTEEEKELIQGPLLSQVIEGDRVIINQVISLTSYITRVVDSSSSVDEGGVVNSVKNREMMNASFEDMAKNAALSFQQEVINAF